MLENKKDITLTVTFRSSAVLAASHCPVCDAEPFVVRSLVIFPDAASGPMLIFCPAE